MEFDEKQLCRSLRNMTPYSHFFQAVMQELKVRGRSVEATTARKSREKTAESYQSG
jgi:hypothetical protein